MTCELCNKREEELNHHITGKIQTEDLTDKQKANYEKLEGERDQISICAPCHKMIHANLVMG